VGAVLLVLAAVGVVVRRRAGRIKRLRDIVALLPCGCDEEKGQGGEEEEKTVSHSRPAALSCPGTPLLAGFGHGHPVSSSALRCSLSDTVSCD